jgi:hypothetical protein
MNLKKIVVGTISIASISLVAPLTWNITLSAEAQCRDSGTRAGGVRILNCTRDGKSCCRKTGRTKVVKGKRYEILDCSRCR